MQTDYSFLMALATSATPIFHFDCRCENYVFADLFSRTYIHIPYLYNILRELFDVSSVTRVCVYLVQLKE